MRILIFGLPRCGTTSLFDFLTQYLLSSHVIKYEPYKTVEYLDYPKMLVKTVLTEEILLFNGESLEEHSKRILKSYDKVIFLVRKDKSKIKESLYDMFVKNTVESRKTLIDKEFLRKKVNDSIEQYFEIFKDITKNKKVYYYENIFSSEPSTELLDLLSYLELPFNIALFEKYIHVKNKDKDIKLEETIL